jgi:hypothetical protein
MKKNTVAVIGILAVLVLMTVGLLTGHNGALLTSSFSIIGGLVGFAFGKAESTKTGKPAVEKTLAFMLALGLFAGGCASTWEVCIVHPKYGKVCAYRVDGKWKITTDATITPEAEAEIIEGIDKLRR